MAILFVGSENLDFSGSYSLDAGSGNINTTYSRSGSGVHPTDVGISIKPGNQSSLQTLYNEVWLHFHGCMSVQGTTGQANLVAVANETLGNLVAVQTNLTNGTANITWNDGAGTQTNSAYFTIPNWDNDFSLDYDLHVKITGTSLFVAFYQDGVLLYSNTFILTTTYQINHFRLYPGGTGNASSWGFVYSQVIFATEPTIGYKVFTRQPTANGSYTEFDGDYTAVDEVGMTDDTVNTAVTARESFQRGTLTVPVGMEVKAIAVNAMVRAGGVGLPNLRLFLRSGGVDYESADFALSSGYALQSKIWSVDPETGIKFTNEKAQASIEFGVRALT